MYIINHVQIYHEPMLKPVYSNATIDDHDAFSAFDQARAVTLNAGNRVIRTYRKEQKLNTRRSRANTRKAVHAYCVAMGNSERLAKVWEGR